VDIVFGLCICDLLCNSIQIGDISLMVLSMMIFKNFSTQNWLKLIVLIFQFRKLSRNGSSNPLSLLVNHGIFRPFFIFIAFQIWLKSSFQTIKFKIFTDKRGFIVIFPFLCSFNIYSVYSHKTKFSLNSERKTIIQFGESNGIKYAFYK